MFTDKEEITKFEKVFNGCTTIFDYKLTKVGKLAYLSCVVKIF